MLVNIIMNIELNSHTKSIIKSIQEIDAEKKNLMKFISSVNLTPEKKILDIGCGYGEKMRLFQSMGLNVVGIDINKDIIQTNLKAGLNCMTIEEFNETNELYDVLLMSHIIEHFSPSDLLKFMDHYLDRLKLNGHLIIATPLISAYFYDDFDHIKPYQPVGINQVFGQKNEQVQYHSKNTIKLIDIWFRRNSLKLNYSRGLYLRKYTPIPHVINLIFAILFHLSFGRISNIDGWMGLYKKIQS